MTAPAEQRIDAAKSRVDRFWAKVNKSGPNGCWIWTAARSDTGYGSFRINRKTYNAHRLAYEELVGAIPDGLQIDHLCRVRACVNPDHLEAVTRQENTRRALTIGYPGAPSTTCKRGHDWTVTPPIIAHRSNGKTSRNCRVCARIRDRARAGQKRRVAA